MIRCGAVAFTPVACSMSVASTSLMSAGLWQQALQPLAQGVNGAITPATSSAALRSLITLRSSCSGLSTSLGSDSRTIRCSRPLALMCLSFCSTSISPDSLARGEGLVAPAAAQRLDQRHAGIEAAAKDVGGVLLGVEQRRLRDDDVEKAHRAGLVLVGGELDRAPRGGDDFCLHGRFLLEDAERGEVVFHLLEGGEHGLAVGRHVLVVGGDRLVGLRAAQAGV